MVNVAEVEGRALCRELLWNVPFYLALGLPTRVPWLAGSAWMGRRTGVRSG